MKDESVSAAECVTLKYEWYGMALSNATLTFNESSIDDE